MQAEPWSSRCAGKIPRQLNSFLLNILGDCTKTMIQALHGKDGANIVQARKCFYNVQMLNTC